MRQQLVAYNLAGHLVLPLTAPLKSPHCGRFHCDGRGCWQPFSPGAASNGGCCTICGRFGGEGDQVGRAGHSMATQACCSHAPVSRPSKSAVGQSCAKGGHVAVKLRSPANLFALQMLSEAMLMHTSDVCGCLMLSVYTQLLCCYKSAEASEPYVKVRCTLSSAVQVGDLSVSCSQRLHSKLHFPSRCCMNQ